MKRDEQDFLIDPTTPLHAKRKNYILRKWTKKGWYANDDLTEVGYALQKKIVTILNMYTKNAGQVVYCKTPSKIVEGIVWLYKPHFDKSFWCLYSWNNNSVHFYSPINLTTNLYYIDKHMDPFPIWEDLNLRAWLLWSTSDKFHLKENGTCLPICQCKNLTGVKWIIN